MLIRRQNFITTNFRHLMLLICGIRKCVSVRTVQVPFNHWPRVKCGLRICGTYNS